MGYFENLTPIASENSNAFGSGKAIAPDREDGFGLSGA
jgi:hypothetical protein